ncbi:protein DpdD [Methylomonas sp. BW4-1]|uniref:protein DpdD n=1 Tax=Methylomonas sp. BW4-1 TaxID=3376685 RepID=UPI004041B460
MIDTLLSRDLSWLEAFFSGRNVLKWEDVIERSAPQAWLEQVLPWITSFTSSGGGLPIVLPVFGPNGPCHWYGMASNEVGANALSQELMAFVGPSFSDFRGQLHNMDSSDVIERSLLERFGRFVFRFDPVGNADCDNIARALQSYLGSLRRRPEIPDRTQRPFGKIRAEFDCALLAGNESDARRLRDELISSGRINAEQQKYLDIRMLAGLGRQYQLAHDYPLIKSVLGLSLPAQTIADLVGTLYSAYIAELEDSGDDEALLDTFRKEISGNFGSLFLERKGIRHPNVLKAFMLFELVQAEPNRDRCQSIVSAYPEDDGRGLIERWAGRLATTVLPQTDLFESARQAMADEDFGLALQFAFDALPAPWTYRVMLQCATEMDDEEVALRVLSAVENVSDTERLKWTKMDFVLIQQLRAEFSGKSEETDVILNRTPRPEADWLSWVGYVESGIYDRPPLQVLEDALTRWSVESYASDPAVCRVLAERIGNASGDTEQMFRDAFAPLVEFFVDRPDRPVRAFGPIYAMLIRIVAWNGMVSANELELASALVQALVSLAPSSQDYVEIVDAYTEILCANNAPSNVDWALNAAEMLALQASPDRGESRLRFFMAVVDMARACAHRLRSVQYEVLSLLAKDYGCSGLLEAFPSLEADSQEQALRTDFADLICIYTLTEPAGQRAQQFLRKLLPQAKVEVNADHVATDKLKHLAANADIFVFAWKSSKHQAYFAVKDARGAKQTLLPLGKGSASILNCVLGQLEHNG